MYIAFYSVKSFFLNKDWTETRKGVQSWKHLKVEQIQNYDY